MQRLSLPLSAAAARLVTEGQPWLFARELSLTSELELADPGELVELQDQRGRPLGLATFNPRNALMVRVLSMQASDRVDTAWFTRRLQTALAKRDAWFGIPYYRLIHSEGDGLPGLIIDRFGDTLVVQASTAGMERLRPFWLEALQQLLSPCAIILRGDTPARSMEGLPEAVEVIGNAPEMPVEVWEHGVCFLADLIKGQKTGWFYDHRENRRRMAAHCADAQTVLDLYSHSGGFGLPALKAGAGHAKLLDRSAEALAMAKQAATRNKLLERCAFLQGEMFDLLPKLGRDGKRYDVVMADPPAFIKDRSHKPAGLKGYEKLSAMCARLVTPGGLFFIASCSHHADPASFRSAVESGIRKAELTAKLIERGEADRDHPAHPKLPENRYLKSLLYRME